MGRSRGENGHLYAAPESLFGCFFSLNRREHLDFLSDSIPVRQVLHVGERAEDGCGRLLEGDGARDLRRRRERIAAKNDRADQDRDHRDEVEKPFHAPRIGESQPRTRAQNASAGGEGGLILSLST